MPRVGRCVMPSRPTAGGSKLIAAKSSLRVLSFLKGRKVMISSNQREENYQEYLRLLSDSDYIEVTYDEQSGGVSAIHHEHKFDKQLGPYGYRRGDYERKVTTVLREKGHRVLLSAERSVENVKNNDGFLDDLSMDIKTVESDGAWSISSKLRDAEKQGAQVVVLYFPDSALYSKERVLDGIGKYESNPQIQASGAITDCLVIVCDQIVDHIKKTTTPSAEWF